MNFESNELLIFLGQNYFYIKETSPFSHEKAPSPHKSSPVEKFVQLKLYLQVDEMLSYIKHSHPPNLIPINNNKNI